MAVEPLECILMTRITCSTAAYTRRFRIQGNWGKLVEKWHLILKKWKNIGFPLAFFEKDLTKIITSIIYADIANWDAKLELY